MARRGVTRLLVLLMVAAAPGRSATESSPCKPPEADAREGVSPPNLDGAIVDFHSSCFGVSLRSQPKVRPRVCITPDTRIFTVYGGHVRLSDCAISSGFTCG
jgi:hypothetical protein